MLDFMSEWPPFLQVAVMLAGAILSGTVLHFIFWRIVRGFAGKTSTAFDDALIRHTRSPSVLAFILLMIYVLLPAVEEILSDRLESFLDRGLGIALIVAVAWLFIKLGSVFEEALLDQYKIDVADNLRARQLHTQMRVIKRVINVVVTVLAIGAILMSFEQVRDFGTGILASAGLAGLIIGFSAQRALSNLAAGIQIAFTQPIRLDDVVIVEGEWGRIEEITLTFVVLKIWDLRRLVVPISYFIETPFQNWTRSSAEILGTIYLYMDYTVPVDEIRNELTRILKASEYWNGQVNGVQVTNTDSRTMEVRALVSADDASKAWNLRCEAREKLLKFLQENYPESLPRVRAEVDGEWSMMEGEPEKQTA